MMIASVIHISRCSTTRPSECLRAVLVELFQVPLELGFECLLQVIALVKEACTKTNAFLLTHPSNQLQLTFVLQAISAFTVLIVPVAAEFFMRRPIFLLTIDATIRAPSAL